MNTTETLQNIKQADNLWHTEEDLYRKYYGWKRFIDKTPSQHLASFVLSEGLESDDEGIRKSTNFLNYFVEHKSDSLETKITKFESQKRMNKISPHGEEITLDEFINCLKELKKKYQDLNIEIKKSLIINE